MSLKKALIAYTDLSGNDVERVLTIKDVVFKYEEAAIEIIYRSRPQDLEKAALAGDEFISHRVAIDLEDPSDVGMVLAASDRIWKMIADQPLITTPTIDTEKGERTTETKSINQIGKIVDA